jgi:hypothetical protein
MAAYQVRADLFAQESHLVAYAQWPFEPRRLPRRPQFF